MNSRDKLILVRLATTQWGVRKFDKAASDEVATNHGAKDSKEIGRFNKILVNLAAIKPVRQAFLELRNRHYFLSAPWSDDGVRVLTAALYFDYTGKIREARADVDRAVKHFVEVEYEAERTAAQKRLGTLYRAKDYPTLEDVRSRFSVRVNFEPLPNPEDVRVWGIGDLAAAQIQREVEASVQQTINAAHTYVVEQVRSRAVEFVEKVRRYDSEETKQLRETAVENLRGVVDVVLRGLNVTGDPHLTALAGELAQVLRSVDVDKLREDPGLRTSSTREVDAIAAKFAGVFGPIARAAGGAP